ncbi:MAG: polysaccharide deacetylase family protein [Chloroflexi bacterium]|nr:polysaccharide deacetylase family protein [Chloroflexota bacterium]
MYLSQPSQKKSKRSALVKRILEFGYHSGLVQLGRPLWANSLTVLNYHRIDNLSPETFQPNVSALPAEFARQMEYLARWYKVVSLQTLHEWLNGGRKLPPHAALITFDDGYLDNYTNAYPILRKHGFSAVIFLTAGHIGTDTAFYWDLTAYCFAHTRLDRIPFPDGTQRCWHNEAEMQQVSYGWIESLKKLPEDEKKKWVARLPELLGVAIPDGYFKRLMMNWDQVREMSANGIEFGGHTIQHPILTRIPPERARSEISGSVARVSEELGKPVTSFAYPNGMPDDFNAATARFVQEAGCQTAFTLLNGPASLDEVRKSPYTVRRSFISHKHSMPEFSTLINPLNRLRH